ncbi:hypothetical protein HPP92_025951 [Vanilla planifolia]|uniref:pectinesterase n=1 Tax=Vanilla planifolia TaxID=51239 RepID=A0A835PDV6_VANPL|nr:hypothetical protein HPP92_025951 [Vanilla planifolia]
MSSHLWMSKRDEIPDRCSTNSTMENPTAVLPVLVLVLLHSHELLASGCEFNSSRQHHHRHVHVGPTGERVIVVDATGSGNFLSVQEAVDSIAENNTMRVIVQINAGYYIEKVVVPTSKPYITFQGSGKESTVIEWHDRASDRGPNGQQLRTYQTASVTVFGNYFIARNISFKNSAPAPLPGMEGWQAAAFRISGTRPTSLVVGFMERKTLYATMQGGITSRTVTSKDQSTSSSAMEDQCTRTAGFIQLQTVSGQ